MKAKKSLGQNFLKSKGAVLKMVKASGVKNGDNVLEIGPGMGVLTDALLATGATVTAVEKDDLLIPILEEKYKNEIKSGKLNLIHGDILDINIKQIFEYQRSDLKYPISQDQTLKTNYKLIANIPYYITGQIIRKFLSSEWQPESMTLLVQKEVAERIVARDKKESLLSLSVKVYGEPKYIQTVKRGSFSPVPNVDSAILHIENISKKNFEEILEENFFKLIHAGFAHKRKQLLPNLAELFPKTKLLEIFESQNIDPKVRAEDLSLSEWLNLCKSFEI